MTEEDLLLRDLIMSCLSKCDDSINEDDPSIDNADNINNFIKKYQKSRYIEHLQKSLAIEKIKGIRAVKKRTKV